MTLKPCLRGENGVQRGMQSGGENGVQRGCAERGVGGVSMWDGWCYDEGRLLAGEVGEGEVEDWVDAEDEVLWQAVDFAAFRWVNACLYLTVE